MENRICYEVGEMIQELRKSEGKSMKPDLLITHCVLNVISYVIFGKRFDHSDQELHKIIDQVVCFIYGTAEVGIVNLFPPVRHLSSFKRKFEKIQAYEDGIMEFIEQRISESMVDRSSSDESFITSFIQAEGSHYDHDQLRFVLRDLLLAGTETSSTTLKWALLMVANHQDVQQRLRDEIDSVVARDRLPSLDERSKLPYVEATILEIWRNWTIAPLSIPRSTLADTTINGCTVPAGTTVSRFGS